MSMYTCKRAGVSVESVAPYCRTYLLWMAAGYGLQFLDLRRDNAINTCVGGEVRVTILGTIGHWYQMVV